MKRRWFLAVFLLVTLLAACQSTPQATVSPTVESSPEAPALEVVGISGTKTYTVEQLKAMAVFDTFAGQKSSTGKITLPNAFKAVKIVDLINEVGGIKENMGVVVEAKDGYSITFSYDQIVNGNFITYDPSTGEEITLAGEKVLAVAYEMEGQPIDPVQEGPLRMIIGGPDKPITDGHWSIKWASKITIKEVTADWSFELEGMLNEVIDRATFESGASPDCHLRSWVDADGNEWSGIPLYYLVGRVDDEIKHNGPAFNKDLAKNNAYTIEVIAKDGYSSTFDSFTVMYDDKILVANLLNGDPLDEDSYPVKLVGEGLQKNQNISQIAKIVLHFNDAAPSATAEPVAATEEATPSAGNVAAQPLSLELAGKVDAPQIVADLATLDQTTIKATHPKKQEEVEYNGVLFSTLIDLAKPQADVSTIVLTASDGYTVEVALADVQACPKCLVAILSSDGYLMSVMPDMESSAWVKNLVKIEFK